MITEKEVERLKKKIEDLKEENRTLKQEKQKIVEEKNKIEDKFKKVEREFEELKLKHAGTVEHLKKAMHLKPNLHVKKKGLGAQKGHKAYTRKIPERIDFIKELNLTKCPECKEQLPERDQEVRQRYITDIKFNIQIENTQYNIHRKYCKHCKKIVEPTVPNALPHARFGLKLMLFIIYLRIAMRLPINKIQEFLTIFNLHISQGEIILIGHQLARAFGPYYKNLERLLKLARVKHSDTTSWRTDGKNYNAWVFVTTAVVLYKITRRINADIALKILGKKQKGNTLVADRHSVFISLAEKAGLARQSCWAHILEDSKALAKHFGKEGKYIHRKLKNIFADADNLEHKGTETQVQIFKERIIQLSKRKYTHSTIRRFCKNLAIRDLQGLFLFVTNPEIEPTNNISERKLRPLVIHRKISNGSRSVAGAKTLATLYSVIGTLKHQNKNPLTGLQEILNPTSGS